MPPCIVKKSILVTSNILWKLAIGALIQDTYIIIMSFEHYTQCTSHNYSKYFLNYFLTYIFFNYDLNSQATPLTIKYNSENVLIKM